MYRPRSSPYGDIFTLPTTAIDNMTKHLYAQQALREQQQHQDIKGMDDMFAKNVSGVRDEDIPEIAQSYNEWKSAKINSYKNPNSKNRIQDDLDTQRKMANTFQKIGNSKQALKTLQDNGKRVALKPDEHYDDAPSMIAMTDGVPTSKLNTLMIPNRDNEIDPATGKLKLVPFNALDYSSYQDKGNVKNWQPILQKIIGTASDKTPISEDYKDEKGTVLGQKVTPIKATNSPANFYTGLVALASSHPAVGKNFRNSFKETINEDNAPQILSEYSENVKNPLWKQAWGDAGLAIPPEALLNPVTRPFALAAMDYANKNSPQLGLQRNVPNPPAIMEANNAERRAAADLRYKRQQAMAGLNFGYRKAMKDYTAGVDATNDESVLNKFIQNTYDSGKTDVTSITVDGKKYTGKVVDIPKDLKDKYIIDKGFSTERKPDDWYLTDDKKQIIPVFYSGEKTASGNKKISALTKPIDIQNFKVDLGKLLLTQKQKGGEVTDQFDEGEGTKSIPTGTTLIGADGHKITTNKPITKKQATDAGYKLQ